VSRKRPWRTGGALRLRIGGYEFAKKGASRYDLRDPYHLAIGLGWPGFLLWVGLAFLAANTGFAALYSAFPGSVANASGFADSFFFSSETLATVGYGEMYPATPYGHAVASFESLCGIVLTAILTGLTFVRFSRPKARILYADRAVISRMNGKPTLMIRLGNARASLMTDAEARLSVLMPGRTREDQFFRRVQELRLERPCNPVFVLTWTVAHVIDDDSPLAGFGPDRPFPDNFRLILSMRGHDHTLVTDVHSMNDWGPSEILFGMRYVQTVGLDEDGRTLADMTQISAVEPEPEPRPAKPVIRRPWEVPVHLLSRVRRNGAAAGPAEAQ
jgi:inward rectifier potassium channel